MVTLVLAGAVLVGTAITYLPFVADDALISFRYSDRLLGGSGLTFTDGQRVEGYSNLLWVLVVAAGGLFSDDLVWVARCAGVLSLVVALGAVVRSVPPNSWRSLIPVIAGLAVVALSHGMAIWAIGGLEQPLLTVLLAWAFALLLRCPTPGQTSKGVGVLLALLVLTRPDGPLIVVLLAVGLVLTQGTSKSTARDVAVVCVMPALAWLGQLAFRLSYYGDWLPNTAYVKLSWSIPRSIEGLRYIWAASRRHAPIVALALTAIGTTRPFRVRQVILPAVVALGWAAYVIFIGGDTFPGRRHVLPIVVCGAFLLSTTWRSSVLGRLPVIAQIAALTVIMSTYAVVQTRDFENIRAREEVWEWDCARLASTLRSAFHAKAPLFAADPVGCIGYFAKMPTLDMMGLNDRHIARTRPADFGRGHIGHELGDGRYVLSRNPDLVLMCDAAGSPTGCFPSGIELVALPEFHRRYILVSIAPDAARYPSRVWVQTNSSRIGISESPRAIRIPGYLFASGRTMAVLSDESGLVARVPPRGTARFDRLSSVSVDWTARAIASRDVTVLVRGSAVIVTAGAAGSDLAEVILTR